MKIFNHQVKKYFSPYLEQFEKQDKNTRSALIFAAFGLLLFFALALTFPFRTTLYKTLFPKDQSKAEVSPSDLIAIRDGTTPWPLTTFTCRDGYNDFGVTCQINLKGHRPRDERLLSFKQKGIEGSGLFEGALHVASNAADVHRLYPTLKPGDQLVLKNGVWKDQIIATQSRPTNGTISAPILIRAETPNGVIFTGNSQITITGSNIFLSGIIMKDMIATEKRNYALRFFKCDYCVATDITIDNFNPTADQLHSPTVPPPQTFMLIVSGKDLTIANSSFSHFLGRGHIISFGGMADGTPARFHLLNSKFFDRPKYVPHEQMSVEMKRSILNGYEELYIGIGSDFSLLEGNIFEKTDGGDEMISIKTNDVIVRNNTFRDNNNSLVLRGTNRTLVEGNTFIGGNRPDNQTMTGGGIRIHGTGHAIINNLFMDIKKNDKSLGFYPLVLAFGDGGGHANVKNVIIAYNTFANTDYGIALGYNHKLSDHPFPPENILFANNVFWKINKAAPFQSFIVVEAGVTDEQRANAKNEMFKKLFFQRNIFSQVPLTGLEPYKSLLDIRAYLKEELPMVRGSRGIWQHDTKSKAIDYIYNTQSFRRIVDWDGLPIKGIRADLGSDELENEGSSGRILPPTPINGITLPTPTAEPSLIIPSPFSATPSAIPTSLLETPTPSLQ